METPKRGPGRPRKTEAVTPAPRPYRNPQRGPVIEDQPGAELQAIITKGSERAKERGHESLHPWKMAAEWGELRCSKCKRTMYVAVHPIPGGPQYGGPAISEKCG